jgi:dGTP triphosphohydrolase
MGPAPGYMEEMWMDHVEHLASPSVYKGNGPMIWILQRREPPQGYHAMDWESFINWIMEDINDTIKAACMTPEEKEQMSSFVEEYKESEQVTTRTLVEQNVTRTFTEYWNGNGAWQTIHQQMHMFVEGLTSNKTHCLIGKETTTSLGISMER